MSGDSLQPNAYKLQEDVTDLLNQVVAMMERAYTALHSDGSQEEDKLEEEYAQKYAGFQKGIKEALQNVKNLELIMSIVAPMKAGKSTIINAIIGQDLLPTRNEAMTTLPTEIIFDDKLTEPILNLSPKIIKIFQRIFQNIDYITQHQNPGFEWARQKLAKQPSSQKLEDLLRQILTGNYEFLMRPEVRGCSQINQVLTELNDAIRLCSELDPSFDPQARFEDIIRIKVPFWRSQQRTEQNERLGSLVMVDTPGPNEDGENLRLSNAVEIQLRRSSIVLIVLDFTGLNNEAAAKIKRQVEPIIRLLGKENLYVLVNKVDQRRKGSMTHEEVRRFVTHDLQLSQSNDADRIFEISAIRAFTATTFMLEGHQYPDIKVTELKTVEALAREAWARWEEKLKETNVEELRKEADFLWKDSGFAPFLEKAINALMKSAAPRTMESALNICRALLCEFLDDIQLRLSSLVIQSSQKIQRQLEALEEDLNHLVSCRQRLQEVNKIKSNLQQNVQKMIEPLKENAYVRLEYYFKSENYERSPLLQKIDIDARGIFSFLLPEEMKYKPSDVIEFSSRTEAEDFANQANSYAKIWAERKLSEARKDTEREIERERTNLKKFLEKETTDIINRARTRLNQEFNIQLSLPSSPPFQSDFVSMDLQIDSETRNVTDYKTKKHRPWYFLWLIEIEKKVPVTRAEIYYIVSLKALVDQINQAIEESVNKISEGINKYLDEDFQQRIDAYFVHLDQYLSNYRSSLEKGLKNQSLPREKKQKLLDELEALVPEATNQIKSTDRYIQRTEQLVQK
ncbi:dynamin family protein [Aetokthonos hydrillicola Thurmond2011]|jgi:GTPase Era involved in 16S rRNA processing|uniref:Dynamin family protein n=1 Tax=Aetokthonos hydrillicola Thurmond2011 TaxID=2712845 RepID=A0AAP5I8Z3_9CYAN|nr:dynamin family protein [Aetokthonos hydrillicola]MBO3461503.1 dynamin family protein [Aetokthonos hydrillicola CCALA 1050]MBW4584859.1 dynamin family protein [Aetokthonos hydrillicola CCALA 1050]MDR9895408.1 dynamin family protein [Aetokthonos hydrillicola Thurmond2011]